MMKATTEDFETSAAQELSATTQVLVMADYLPGSVAARVVRHIPLELAGELTTGNLSDQSPAGSI